MQQQAAPRDSFSSLGISYPQPVIASFVHDEVLVTQMGTSQSDTTPHTDTQSWTTSYFHPQPAPPSSLSQTPLPQTSTPSYFPDYNKILCVWARINELCQYISRFAERASQTGNPFLSSEENEQIQHHYKQLIFAFHLLYSLSMPSTASQTHGAVPASPTLPTPGSVTTTNSQAAHEAVFSSPSPVVPVASPSPPWTPPEDPSFSPVVTNNTVRLETVTMNPLPSLPQSQPATIAAMPPHNPPGSPLTESKRSPQPKKRSRPTATGQICTECGATQTPEWRRGPNGPKTLCNACGLHYAKQLKKARMSATSGAHPPSTVPPLPLAPSPSPQHHRAPGFVEGLSGPRSVIAPSATSPHLYQMQHRFPNGANVGAPMYHPFAAMYGVPSRTASSAPSTIPLGQYSMARGVDPAAIFLHRSTSHANPTEPSLSSLSSGASVSSIGSTNSSDTTP